MSEELLPNDPVLNVAFNEALDWAAGWILYSVSSDASKETIEFAKNMAMSIRAGKREVGFQESFFDAVKNDPYMTISQKKFWIAQEGGTTPRALDACPHCAGSGDAGEIGLPRKCSYCAGTGKRQ